MFPHPTLLNVESSFPTHPFLLSACLYYVIRCDISVAVFTPEQIRHIETFLFQNLNAYHRGCRPSNEGILASFILSFLPVSILTTEGSELDPMRMVGLAYSQIREMGQSVYLDRLVNFVDSGVPIGHLEKQLNDARMFMGVINRSAWCVHSLVSAHSGSHDLTGSHTIAVLGRPCLFLSRTRTNGYWPT